MNSLSWFLYLADVLGNVQGMFGFLSFMIGLCSLFALGAYFVAKESGGAFPLWPGLSGSIFAFVLGVTAAFIPSKDTIYLIAGSEAGEMVIQNEETKAIIGDVRDVIKLQLQKLKE